MLLIGAALLLEHLFICRVDTAVNAVAVRAVFLVNLLAAELGKKTLEGGNLLRGKVVVGINAHFFVSFLYDACWKV
jgi:hypothetical protein